MANRKFSFPIGSTADIIDSAFVAHFKSISKAGENDFEPGNINAEYTFSDNADENDKSIMAIWDGTYTILNGVITSEAFPDEYLQLLQETYGEDIPVPKKVIYGPVDSPDSEIELYAGEQIGNLMGNTFFIRFVDQNDFIINAYFCLNFLHIRNFFESNQSTGFPFSRSNTNDRADLLFNETLPNTSANLKIIGGSFSRSIYNPPAVIPAALFSFLSNDQIEISILNGGSGSFRIEIEDLSDKMYRTKNLNPIVKNVSSFKFTPQIDLKSNHLPYSIANGKRDAGMPLKYAIKIYANNNLICSTQIQQDLKDTIRQEYIFHSQPFQIQPNIDVPKRINVTRNNIASDYYNCNIYNAHNNYGASSDAWLLNAEENIKVAEFIRRHFSEEIRRLKDSVFPNIPKEICTADLNINSSWRNPERNEVVGGVRNSNHQFGRAEDLASIHHKSTGSANMNNVSMHCALFHAGKVFLERLIAINGAGKCMHVEILLEKGATLYLSYITNNFGLIELKKNVANLSASGISTTGTDTAVISAAAAHASHVHIGWKSSTIDPLILPDFPPYDIFDTASLPLKNIILVPTEHNSVPDADQFPFPHIANTIKKCLDNADDGIETIILDVANTLDVLEWMGAYSNLYRINEFFLLGHATENGMIVKNTNQPIVDIPLQNRIKLLYGKEPSYNENGSLKKDIFGTDAFTQFMPNEFSISNILFLPAEITRRIRAQFKDAKNIFILGYNNTINPAANNNNFCKAFAGLLNKPVYGAAYFNKTFDNTNQKWQEIEISSAEPLNNGHQYVLATDTPATEQFINNLLGNGSNEFPLLAADLLHYYKQSLELVFFDPIKDARAISLEIVETIDN